MISARLSACIWNMRPMRSLPSFVVFITVSPIFSVPAYTRTKVSVPYLSLMILNASPANGAFGSALMRRRSLCSPSSSPSSAATEMPGTSIGEGR